MIDDKQLLQILAIAHRTSRQGGGVSLHQALQDADYLALRQHFDVTDLRRVVSGHSELIDQWIRYSEDKRTTGGWYLSDLRIGSFAETTEIRFASVVDAVANYAIRELDFWCKVGAT